MDPIRLKELLAEWAAVQAFYAPRSEATIRQNVVADSEWWYRGVRVVNTLAAEAELCMSEEQRAASREREYSGTVRETLAAYVRARKYFDENEAAMWAAHDAGESHVGWDMLNDAWNRLTALAEDGMTDGQRARPWVPTREWALADKGLLPAKGIYDA